MTQLVNHGPPVEQLCLNGCIQSRTKVFKDRDHRPGETKVLGGWPMFYQLCNCRVVLRTVEEKAQRGEQGIFWIPELPQVLCDICRRFATCALPRYAFNIDVCCVL